MMLTQDILVTEKGWKRLHAELQALQKRQSSEVTVCRELAKAAEPGALASEYLQSEVAPLDRRIAYLEEVLAHATPVGSADREPGTVEVGSEVSVLWEDGAEESYVVVGPPEVDLEAGLISYESPVGQALLGARQGEEVTVATPGGALRLEVLAIS